MNRYLVAAVLASLLFPRPAVAPAIAAPIGELQKEVEIMAKVKGLGRAALKLGYSCHEIGQSFERCSVEFDDVFDKAMAGEPL